MKRPSYRRRGRGMTLIEVMVASAILAIITLSSLGAIMVSSNISRAALEDIEAMEFANREIELIKSNRLYNTIGVTEWVSTDPNADRKKFQFDPSTDFGKAFAPTFDITYKWYGFGTTTAASGTSVTFNSTNWPTTISFINHRLVLRPTTGGSASAAIANITAQSINGSSGSTFTTSCAMNGWTTAAWDFTPPTGTYFEVDGGKWCRITIAWTTGTGKSRSYVRDIFIPWRQDPGA